MKQKEYSDRYRKKKGSEDALQSFQKSLHDECNENHKLNRIGAIEVRHMLDRVNGDS